MQTCIGMHTCANAHGNALTCLCEDINASMQAYICADRHTWMCPDMYRHEHVLFRHRQEHMCAETWVGAHMCRYMCTDACTCVQIKTCTGMHVYIGTHIHEHADTSTHGHRWTWALVAHLCLKFSQHCATQDPHSAFFRGE